MTERNESNNIPSDIPAKIPTKIPVSVLVVTKNEESRIRACLEVLTNFDEVIVVDSNSDDSTQKIAADCGATVINLKWNGHYPKKRQWCLNSLELAHEWVFFVDADEILTPELQHEIAALFNQAPPCEGYFVRGQYSWQDKILRHGLHNNKLVLFDRRKIEFPVVDDLDMPGMGEIEGHYQPVLKTGHQGEEIGQLQAPLLHYACEDRDSWQRRHERYADWEAAMNKRGAWPLDPDRKRQRLKVLFRGSPFRPVLAFLHSYVFKLGFLDGFAGFDFALSRRRYYQMIRQRS